MNKARLNYCFLAFRTACSRSGGVLNVEQIGNLFYKAKGILNEIKMSWTGYAALDV